MICKHKVIVQTTVNYALEHPELGFDLPRYLRENADCSHCGGYETFCSRYEPSINAVVDYKPSRAVFEWH